MTIYIDDIINRAKSVADMVDTNIVTDNDWQDFFNIAGAELHELLCDEFDDLFIMSSSFTLSSGQSVYNLPTQFTGTQVPLYKLRGIDKVEGTDSNVALEPYSFAVRNHGQTTSWQTMGSTYPKYRLQANEISFKPTQSAPGNYTLFFIPPWQDMVSGSTTPVDSRYTVNHYEDYIVLHTAIQALEKEESDTSSLQLKLDRLQARIRSSATSRDAGGRSRVIAISDPLFDDDSDIPRMR